MCRVMSYSLCAISVTTDRVTAVAATTLQFRRPALFLVHTGKQAPRLAFKGKLPTLVCGLE